MATHLCDAQWPDADDGRRDSWRCRRDGSLIARTDVNAKNGAGETALMLAATYGNPKAVQLLLDKGADARVRTKRSETALGNAGRSGNAPPSRCCSIAAPRSTAEHPRLFAADARRRLGRHDADIVKLLMARRRHELLGRLRRDGARSRQQARRHRGRHACSAAPKAATRATRTASHPSHGGAIAEGGGDSVPLLEKQSHNFIRIGGCNSCHAQDLRVRGCSDCARPRAFRCRARSRSFRIDDASPERIMDLNIIGVASVAWELFDFGMNGVPKTLHRRGRPLYQSDADAGGELVGERKPAAADGVGDFQSAALAIYALKHTRRSPTRRGRTRSLRGP